jgi:hypothetical protein
MASPPNFVFTLLGRTAKGKPNTADGDSTQSVAIAEAVLDILDISGQAPGAQQAGTALEDGVKDFLADELPQRDPSHAWVVERGGQISRFRQYAHLARLDRLVEANEDLRVEIGQDYLISPDVTVSFPIGDGPRILHAAVSCKFSIRSDRVQNIRHESVAMIRHRRGRSPHIVTVTSEPLPSRLASICRGTGEVDAVYHVCLPALKAAVNSVGNAQQKRDLAESMEQGRLYDLIDLGEHFTL